MIKSLRAVAGVMGALIAPGICACGSSPSAPASAGTAGGQGSAASSPAATRTPTPEVPVLKPGHTAAFKAVQQDGPAAALSWTMGRNVVRVPDNSLGKHGFEDVAFNLTVKNTGTTVVSGDPTFTTWLLARSPDGRTDETLQSTAATNISDGTHGLTGSDLSLVTGLQPGTYVSGYVEWPEPNSTTMVFVLNPNTSQLEQEIDLGTR